MCTQTKHVLPPMHPATKSIPQMMMMMMMKMSVCGSSSVLDDCAREQLLLLLLNEVDVKGKVHL